MIRLIANTAVPVFMIAMVVVPIVLFRLLLRRIRSGGTGKLRGFGFYALGAFSPTLLYTTSFFVLVGLEELSGAALIPEEAARGFSLVLGFGVAVWLVSLITFAAVIVWPRCS